MKGFEASRGHIPRIIRTSLLRGHPTREDVIPTLRVSFEPYSVYSRVSPLRWKSMKEINEENGMTT
jgi:hypothetical protein